MTVGHDLRGCQVSARVAAQDRPARSRHNCQIAATDGVYRRGNHSRARIVTCFQIVRLTLDDKGKIAVRRPLQPLFELREDAMAMAEFDASRLWGDYGCDDEHDCWWATDARGCKYRFIVEPVASTEAAA